MGLMGLLVLFVFKVFHPGRSSESCTDLSIFHFSEYAGTNCHLVQCKVGIKEVEGGGQELGGR